MFVFKSLITVVSLSIGSAIVAPPILLCLPTPSPNPRQPLRNRSEDP